MKLPNGYGSVVKLKGKRRNPWAVRISYLEEQPDGIVKRKRKYLEYFMKQESALSYLAEYNNGGIVQEHQKYSDVPTFAKLYDNFGGGLCLSPSLLLSFILSFIFYYIKLKEFINILC